MKEEWLGKYREEDEEEAVTKRAINQGVEDFRFIKNILRIFSLYYYYYYYYYYLSFFSILFLPTTFTHTHAHDPHPLPTTFSYTLLLRTEDTQD